MSGIPLRLLLVEDSEDDAGLITRALGRGGRRLATSVVDGEQSLRSALASAEYDLAITDHELRGFDSAAVLSILAELAPDLPCLLVSGKVGEEVVSKAMREGAADYVAKDNLWRLPAAVDRMLEERDQARQRRAVDDALARSGQLFEAVFLNAHDAILIVDDERRVTDANPAAALMLGTSRADLFNSSIDEIMPPAWRVNASRVWKEFLSSGTRHGDVDIVRADGALAPTEFRAVASFLPGRHIVMMRDIRDRRAAEAEVKRRISQQQAIAELGEHALREKRLDLVMDAVVARVASTLEAEIATIAQFQPIEGSFAVRAEVGPVRTGERAHLPYLPSARSQATFTLNQQDAVLVEDYAQETRFELAESLRASGVRSALSVAIPGVDHPFGIIGAASSSSRAFDADDASFLTAVAHLLADALERARSEEEVRVQGLHDALTGLPNRTLFFDRLDVGLARTKRTDNQVAVIFFDIDHFKNLNDSLGHLATDNLLTQIGSRLAQTMRESDTVARFGGDEFVVLCEDVSGESEAAALAKRLQSALKAPFFVGDEPHKLSASMGVALSGVDNLDGEELLRDADVALYRSKESGRGTWTLATKEMRLAAATRTETKQALEHAIEAGELVLHYQPIVGLADGAICGVEALVRWDHPDRGLIAPGEFIPLAEESDLILRLGEWVLRAACRQAAVWRAGFAERAPLPVHVNFSARQVAQVGTPELVSDVLKETRVSPADIVVEITETALIDGLGAPLSVLGQLKASGIEIVLDDFGTGYSSLSYLERFPIDTLKIDQAFVTPLGDSTAPAPIFSAIVGMARALGLRAVAEGVETAEQAAAIAALGCDYAQGYFFARPTSPEQVATLALDAVALRARAAEAWVNSPEAPDPPSPNADLAASAWK